MAMRTRLTSREGTMAAITTICFIASSVHSRAGRPASSLRSTIVASGDEVSLGGFSRSSGGSSSGGSDASSAVILQHDIERLTLPGMSQQLHLYDSSNLSALRSAMNKGSFVHVALDPEATARRAFFVASIGTECRIISATPSSKQNKYNEASPSLVVDVIGIRQRRVLKCTQFEPHVRAILSPLKQTTAPVGLAEGQIEELDILAQACHELRSALKMPSVLVDTETMRRDMASAVPAEDWDEAAWASARVLSRLRDFSSQRRLGALQICEPAELLEFALAGLREERQRLVAMKSLQSL